VDVLFQSATRPIGRQVIGIILTGMGADGAQQLLALRQAGAITFGQDRGSCVVYGMPKVAFEIGAVEQQASPAEIPRLIIKTLQAKGSRRTTALR
jgi:two-component system chemotaxis response regulator CheB